MSREDTGVSLACALVIALPSSLVDQMVQRVPWRILNESAAVSEDDLSMFLNCR
jgi:hypothetical protein